MDWEEEEERDRSVWDLLDRLEVDHCRVVIRVEDLMRMSSFVLSTHHR